MAGRESSRHQESAPPSGARSTGGKGVDQEPGQGANHRSGFGSRLAWFVGLWLAGVAAVSLVGFAIKAALG